MKESLIEAYVIQQVRKLGGVTRKVTYQGRTGAPDRWLFFPCGKLIIMELKAAGKKPRPDQDADIAELRALGFSVYVVSSKGQVDEILSSVARP